jgi:hypothetical protein
MNSSPQTQDRPTGALSSSAEERAGVRSRLTTSITVLCTPFGLRYTACELLGLADRIEPDYNQMTADSIILATALHFGTTTHEITRRQRPGTRNLPRQLAIYIIKADTTLDLRAIAKMFGYSPSSVSAPHAAIRAVHLLSNDKEADISSHIRAIRGIASRIAVDPTRKQILSKIERLLIDSLQAHTQGTKEATKQ